MENSIVEVKNVSFNYEGISVLEDVNITIEKNDFLALIGPNGGGKTTLLKLILGLIKPSQGSITVFGASPKQGRRNIGYLPQLFTFDFYFPISVIEVVLMGRLKEKGLGKRFTKSDTDSGMAALAKVGLEELKNRAFGNLSGGQRQRVLIARALTTEPKLLLLDEPVSSIDTKWQQSFYELLHELNKKIAIVLVTHDIGVISTYIDKIACVNKRLYYHGSKKEGLHKISEIYECAVQLITHTTQPSAINKDEG